MKQTSHVNLVKMTVLPKTMYTFNPTPIKILTMFFFFFFFTETESPSQNSYGMARDLE